VAAGPARRGASLRMCGSGGRQGEKAVDKFMEGNGLERYSVGLSISNAKSCFGPSCGRFLLRFPSTSLCCLAPSVPTGWEGSGSFAPQPGAALPGLTPADGLGSQWRGVITAGGMDGRWRNEHRYSFQ